MFIFFYIGILFIVYVSSFKDDIKKEYIDEAMPFIMTLSIVFILIGVLGSIGK